jgi:hypothetical protein
MRFQICIACGVYVCVCVCVCVCAEIAWTRELTDFNYFQLRRRAFCNETVGNDLNMFHFPLFE